MRRIGRGGTLCAEPEWPENPFPPGRGLSGKLCGIVGLGEIGREVAKRVEACGMSVCYHGPRKKDDVRYRFFEDLAEYAQPTA